MPHPQFRSVGIVYLRDGGNHLVQSPRSALGGAHRLEHRRRRRHLGRSAGLCEVLGRSVARRLVVAGDDQEALDSAAEPEIQRHPIEGLGHYYNGDYARAFPAFLSILREQPNHAKAQYWLGRSFLAAGLPDLAKVQLQEFLREHPGNARIHEVKGPLKEIDAGEG